MPAGIHRVPGIALAGLSLAIAVGLCLLYLTNPAPAAIVATGNVQPADPARWTSSTTAYVGKTTAGTLAITEGSGVVSNLGFVGYSSGSTGNVTVDGAGSTWTNSSVFYVGKFGSGTLSITGGGAVSSFDSDVGSLSGSTGAVIVEGAGSIWTNSREIDLGVYGSGTLNVTGGGAVISCRSRIGYVSGSTGVVTVEGTGSTWANSDDLHVGYGGSGTLNIANGGLVKVAHGTYVDWDKKNQGVIHFDGGTLETGLLVAEESELSGTGTVILHGIVADRDVVFDSADDLTAQSLLNGQPGQNITVHLSIDGQGLLGAGYAGVGSLAISNGVEAASAYGYIGSESGSMGVVTVEGTGSTWISTRELYVGWHGNGTLSITGGGAVGSSECDLGCFSGSTGKVMVDGTGATWTNTSRMCVGREGRGTLSITGGGAVSSSDCYLGYSSGSTGAATVEGAGSTWTSSSGLRVGDSGNGTLLITGGGAVSSGFGYIGNNSGSTGNVTVAGTDSNWTNGSGLCLGNSGSGTLLITGGGTVSSSGGLLGAGSRSTGVVTVEGTGSTWSNSSDLYVGRSGTGTLSITTGGFVRVAGDTYVDQNNVNRSAIRFDGGTLETGSLRAEESELMGTGTIILHGIIADRNLVFNSPDDLTGQSFTYNSQPGQNITVHLNVDGQGSLGAGYNGTGSLAITGGVEALSTFGYIGYNSGSTGVVIVEGAGSTWSNSSYLYVGNSGSGTLSITNGGFVKVNGSTYVSSNKGSQGVIHFDGGTLETGSLRAEETELTGAGTIILHGIIADRDLVFDSPDDLTGHPFTYNSQPGQNIAVHLSIDGQGPLGAGYAGTGSMSPRPRVTSATPGARPAP